MVVVSSTKETKPVIFNDTFYKFYPNITEEMIGSNTTNMFVDTLMISNLILISISGDYDGDMVGLKGVYTEEANAELIKHINSKANYIGFDGSCIRISTNESIQAIFCLTRVLSDTKISGTAEF